MDFYQIKVTLQITDQWDQKEIRTLYFNVPDHLPAEAIEFDGTIRLELFSCQDLIKSHYPTLTQTQIQIHNAIIVTDVKSNFLADRQASIDANPPKVFKATKVKVIKLMSDDPSD